MKFPFYDEKATGHGILLPCSRSVVVKPSFLEKWTWKHLNPFSLSNFRLPSTRVFFLFSSFYVSWLRREKSLSFSRMDMRIKLLVIFHSTDFFLALLYRFKYFILLCLILGRMNEKRTKLYCTTIYSKDDNGCACMWDKNSRRSNFLLGLFWKCKSQLNRPRTKKANLILIVQFHCTTQKYN